MNIVLVEPLGITNEMLLEFKNRINDLGHKFTYYNSKPKDQNELKERIIDQDIIMIANYPLSLDVLKSNTKIKYIAVAFTGLDHIPLNYCLKNGIKVSNCSGYSTTSVSEQVIGMTISLYRYIHLNNEITLQGQTSQIYGAGEEIKDKTVGIIGLGEIGLQTAKLFEAFGANVIYYSRTKKDVKYKYVELDYLLKNSNIISLHIPSNEDTYHFLDKDKLDLVNNNCIIINTARGKVIDNEYLAYLLNEGKIKGAAIDVFDYEPPLNNDYPLLHSKNTLLTPHTAFLTKEALIRRANIEFSNVIQYLK